MSRGMPGDQAITSARIVAKKRLAMFGTSRLHLGNTKRGKPMLSVCHANTFFPSDATPFCAFNMSILISNNVRASAHARRMRYDQNGSAGRAVRNSF